MTKKTALGEKDSLQDMLTLEKNLVKVYSTALTEGVSKGFREHVKEHLAGTVDDQFNVFMLMTELDYAEVKSAPAEELMLIKDKFKPLQAQLS